MDNDVVSLDSAAASIIDPVITRSAPNEDGFVTWTVEYETSVRIAFHIPPDAGEFSVRLSFNELEPFDYYTGLKFPSRELYVNEDAGESSDSYDYATEVEFFGQHYSVSYGRSSDMTFGDWEQDGDVVVKKVTTIERMYITAPQDYDGLMIGIDVVTPPSDEEVLNLNSEDTIDDSELEYWDSFEESENWEFIRLTDFVDKGEASAE